MWGLAVPAQRNVPVEYLTDWKGHAKGCLDSPEKGDWAVESLRPMMHWKAQEEHHGLQTQSRMGCLSYAV